MHARAELHRVKHTGEPRNMVAIEKLLVTVEQAVEILSLSRRTLWKLTKEGKLPAVRHGRAVRYAVEDLRRYVEQQREASK